MSLADEPSSGIKIFYSYAHKDEELRIELEKHLSHLKRSHLVAGWHDRMIYPGMDWAHEIDAHLNTAHIILLLISSDFMHSDYCHGIEMKRALERYEAGEAHVIPVILRYVDWEDNAPFKGLQALPAGGKPVTSRKDWSSNDEAFADIAKGIRKIINTFFSSKPIYPSSVGTAKQLIQSHSHSEQDHPNNYIPLSPSPIFQCRSGEFEYLANLLFGSTRDGKPTHLSLLGLVGMPGVGKTQLAIEFVEKYRNRFPSGIFWMPANKVDPLEYQHLLAELAAHIGYLPLEDNVSHPENELQRARYFCRYLVNHADALLILDNVEDLSSVLKALLLVTGERFACTIFYTSRKKFHLPGGIDHQVKHLSEESALHLLLEKTARSSLLDQILTGSRNEEIDAACEVCRRIGYLPLALIHLRRLLERDHLLTLVRLNHALRGRGPFGIAQAPEGELVPLFATFELSWKQVHNEEAKRLFILASYFPEAIPIPLWLLGLAAGLGEQGDVLEPLGEARVQLEHLNLLESSSDGLVLLHPLVRAFGQQLVVDGFAKKDLLVDANKRITSNFEDLNALEKRVRNDGFWECIKQIQMARKYVELLGTGDEKRLGQIERWLIRESNLLGEGKFWPDMIPGLFYQQIFNRSVEEDYPLSKEQLSVRWIRQLKRVGVEDRSLVRLFLDQASDAKIECVAFTPDGTRILSGSSDGMARLWDMFSGKVMTIFAGHSDSVTVVACSPSGKKIITGSADRTAQIAEIVSGKVLWTLKEHSDRVTGVTFSPDGEQVLTGSLDGTACLWEVESGCLLKKLQGHNDGVTSVAFSPDGKQILTGSMDKTARLWDAEGDHVLVTLDDHTGAIWSVAFSSDGKYILTGSNDQTVRLWESATGHLETIFEGHTGRVTSVAFSSDGKYILTGSNDQTVRLWDTISRKLLKILKGHTESVNSVAVSPKSILILSGSDDRTMRLWEIVSDHLQAPLPILDAHSKRLRSAVFSPDGTQLLTGSDDGIACLWDVTSGNLLRVLKGHAARVMSVAFSPDGTQLLTGSDDKTACLWDVTSGNLLRVLKGHAARVMSVAFSPDRTLIVTGSGDGAARLWETASGTLQAKWEDHSGSITKVMFSSDNCFVLTCDQHGRVLFRRTRKGTTREILWMYTTAYEVGAIYWHDARYVVLADMGGSLFRPHFYHLRLEGTVD